MIAFRALDLHLEAGLGTAVLHRRQCPRVLEGDAVSVLRQEVGLEGGDDRSQRDHMTFPQLTAKPSIKPLMRSRA